jgi:hypothetical protein
MSIRHHLFDVAFQGRHGIAVATFLSFLLSIIVDDRRRTPDPFIAGLTVSPLLPVVCRRIRQLGATYMLPAIAAGIMIRPTCVRLT